MDGELVKLDGVMLDLIVDYLTYVFIPSMFMWKFGLFPESISILMSGAMLFSGALYFARTDMKSDDKWFIGFPGSWNFVVFILWLLGTSGIVNSITVAVFVVLSGTSIETLHVFRSKQLRKTTVSLTVLFVAALVSMIGIEGQLHNNFGRLVIVLWFVYYIATAIWKTWIYKTPIKTAKIAKPQI